MPTKNPVLARTMERIEAFVMRCKEQHKEIIFIDCEGGQNKYVEAIPQGDLCVLRYATFEDVFETQIDEGCVINNIGTHAICGIDLDGESWKMTTMGALRTDTSKAHR